MKIRVYLAILLMFSLNLLNVSVARAQPTGSELWQAAYWDNLSFAGEPRVIRTEGAINYNWGAGSPVPGVIAPERFAARWTGALSLAPGRYRFTVTADDGVRLWVNEQLLIDEWTVQSRQTYQADVMLASGVTSVRLDYFENTAQAEIQLTWQPLDGASTGTAPPAAGAPINVWHGEYYDNLLLTGTPVLVRNDAQLNFDWGSGSPAPGVIAPERFSVRWTRTLSLNPGRYQFAANVDDGVRLWIDGRLLLDDWAVHSVRTLGAEVTVAGGAVPVRMEYFENTGVATAQLTWTQLPAGDAPLASVGPTATVVGVRYLNVRSGPGIGFAGVSVLGSGGVVELLGRNADATWAQIRLASGGAGWVNSRYLNSAMPLSALPITR